MTHFNTVFETFYLLLSRMKPS